MQPRRRTARAWPASRPATRYFPGALRIIFLGALVSAILSTVDSALLSAGSLTAHNLILPLTGAASERRKVAVNRGAVVGFGVLAYAIALSADGVYALVEEASAFGTAGVFVCMMFGLFTRIGAAAAALTALGLGFSVYLLGEHVLGWPQPYLASLAAALAGYLSVAAVERLCGVVARRLEAT